jgi:hypothetical protein
MDDPHYADVGRASPGRLPGEDVNCHNENEGENDIHINLVQRPAPPKPLKNDSDAVKERKRAARKAALCKAIVAEVIPHFRPAMFEVDNLDPIFRKKVPVRVSGQLFFDASHRPCAGSTPRDSSVRGSLWEIHPIYSIDICKHNTLTQCSAANDQVWVPINDWLSSGVIRSMELQATKAMRLQEEDDREGEHEGE